MRASTPGRGFQADARRRARHTLLYEIPMGYVLDSKGGKMRYDFNGCNKVFGSLPDSEGWDG